jgi:transposase
MGYDKVLRERAVLYREKHGQKQTCQAFGISASALKKWQKQYKETGSLGNKPLQRKWRKIDPEKLRAAWRHTPTISTMKGRQGSAAAARRYGRGCRS